MNHSAMCRAGCGRYSQGRTYARLCVRCFTRIYGTRDPMEAIRMRRAVTELERAWTPMVKQQDPETRILRTVTVEGQEYDVVYDGT